MNLNYKKLNKIAQNIDNSFYILDTIQFQLNYNNLLKAFRNKYKNTHIAYSYKTNYIPKLCKLINEWGGFAEVVSHMEYEVAVKIGVRSENIFFNGPYKKTEAVEELLLNGGVVNIDSDYDFEMIESISKKYKDKILRVALRCNFDINDGVLSRFGFDIYGKVFKEVIEKIKASGNIKLIGLHSHFATRTLETWPIRVRKILNLSNEIFENPPEFISVGGGLYGNMEKSLKEQFNSYIPTYDEYASAVAELFEANFKDAKAKPKLIIEPGSALVGDVMKFVAPVLNIKDIRGKNIATLLGSIYNINPTLNKKNPPIEIYSEKEKQGEYFEDIDFGGFTCIETDYLYRGFSGRVSVGDYVVFSNVGSYSVVLKPPFILPNFPIVELTEDNVNIVKQKETTENIFNTFEF